MLAPIILLVYNRPAHARQTLEALMANDLAKDSTLFIFADGPKAGASLETLQKIEETRKVIKEKQWCGTVHITDYQENYGVDASTIKHVTEVVNKYGKIIVLEDDIVTSKGFLKYMNDALDVYESEEKVRGITGYIYPIKNNLPSTFLMKGGNGPWGWGTWKRAWNKFNTDYNYLTNIISIDPILKKEFNFDNSYNYYQMLSSCTEYQKPWDVRWYASVFIDNGFSLWPGKSLVQNVGHDASGEHCGVNDKFYHKTLQNYIKIEKLPLKVNIRARQEVIIFFKSLNKISLVNKIRWKLSPFIPLFAKRIYKNIFI